MPSPVPSSASPAGRNSALAATCRHRSKATGRRNDAATRACFAHDREPGAPPWARRSCVRRPATSRYSNSAEEGCGQHAPRLAPASPYNQQLQHLSPTHLLLARWQFPLPEPIQMQLPPPFASQPAVAERPRAPQLHFRQLDLNTIDDAGGNLAVFREQAQSGVALARFVEHLQALAPGGLLAVVDLAQVQHAALHHLPAPQTPALLDAEIAMLFAVFASLVAAQEHASSSMPEIAASVKRVGLHYTAWGTSDSRNKSLMFCFR